MGQWRKSSRSQGRDHCVEVRFTDDTIYIRDSKYFRDPANAPSAQPIIAVPAECWDSFLRLATGHLVDLTPELPLIDRHGDGGVTIRSQDGTSLYYTAEEWSAYVAGVQAGEFAAA